MPTTNTNRILIHSAQLAGCFLVGDGVTGGIYNAAHPDSKFIKYEVGSGVALLLGITSIVFAHIAQKYTYNIQRTIEDINFTEIQEHYKQAYGMSKLAKGLASAIAGCLFGYFLESLIRDNKDHAKASGVLFGLCLGLLVATEIISYKLEDNITKSRRLSQSLTFADHLADTNSRDVEAGLSPAPSLL
jgi:hypothetical protein